MTNKLAVQKCTPCEEGTQPLTPEQTRDYMKEIGSRWTVVDNHHIEKEYELKDFKEALAFVNRVGAVAEQEGHHPAIWFTWGKVKITIWTHKVDGLTENDFILAAKADAEL